MNAATKTVIITGGNSGLGRECARTIARDHSTRVVLACRRLDAGEEAARSIRESTGNQAVDVMKLDLSALGSVREFAQRAREASAGWPPVRALVCNAAVQVLEPTKSSDGHELTFAVNHLGHYLLIQELRELLTRPARIVVVASGVHDPSRFTGMPKPTLNSGALGVLADADAAFAGDDPHPIAGRRAYVNSKACNMLFTYEFARRLEREGLAQELTVTAFCPGLMPGSGLSRNYTSFQRFVWNYIMPIMRVLPGVNSTRTSGAALARLAMDPALEGVTGKFFEGRRESRSSDESYDEEKAAELWQLSERLCA